MPQVAIPIIGAIASNVIGGAMGANAADKERNAAENARRAALSEYGGISLPDIEQQKLNLGLLQQQGSYTPDLEQSLALGPSAMEQVSTDPRLRQAQLQALEQISGVAQGGLTPADMAAIEQTRRTSEAQNQARQQAILQDMQQRGQGGSGAELIARLKGAQDVSDRASQANLETAQMAQQRALQAMGQQASLAGSIRGQEFGESSDVARARDLINQFNTQNQQNVGQRNVGAKNTAQQQNLGERQRVADTNVGLLNQQQMANKALQQQQLQNQLNLAAARAGQFSGSATAADTRAGQQASMWTGLGQSIGQGILGTAATKKKTTETE